MREIKFRAWVHDPHKEHSENPFMTDDFSMNIIYNPKSICVADGNFGWIYSEGSHDLMQFTGLTDRNGKEIYEGDVLFHDKHNVYSVMRWVDKYICFAGETIDEIVKGEYNFYQKIDEPSLKIIGNIHKNPELLK